MKVLTKGELVDLDESFLEMLGERDVIYPDNFKKRFIIIYQTDPGEWSIESIDTLDAVNKHIKVEYEEDRDESGYNIHSIWDLEKKLKIEHSIEVKVELKYPGFYNTK